MLESKWIGALILSCKFTLNVRMRPFTSLITRSTRPLMLESPTLESSNAVGVSTRVATNSFQRSMMAGSVSVLTMIPVLPTPTVANSLTNFLGNQTSDAKPLA